MELNQAQLLVHDNTTMEKFRRDHNIPNDVAIERLGHREEANTVEGEGHPCSHLVDSPNSPQIPYQSFAERSYGSLLTHLYASVR